MQREYTHTSDFTEYMNIVYQIINDQKKKQKTLDIPAGNGLLSMKLKEDGHDVTCADINSEREGYVYADMSETLPFETGEFDTVICLEGLEHVLEPKKLISELCRVCKNKGRIIISLPNVQNMYSRLQFLCTGTFHQFPPILPTDNLQADEKVDLGHISPLGYIQLRYLFKYFRAEILDIQGDKYKRKFLLPFLCPFLLIGLLWQNFMKKSDLSAANTNHVEGNLFKPPLLFSRSLILVFEKNSQ